MSHKAANKRKFERFDLTLPALVETGGGEQKISLKTRDISAGGAFFATGETLAQGAKLTIEITISNAALTKLTGTHPKISVRGTVVRCDADGVAVRFSGHEQIMPISMMDN